MVIRQFPVLTGLILLSTVMVRAQHMNIEKIDGVLVTESIISVEKVTFPSKHLSIGFNDNSIKALNLRTIGKIYFDTVTEAELMGSDDENELTLFPNPAITYFLIGNLPDQDVLLSIHSLWGEQVQQETVSMTTPQVKLKELPSGIYLVKVNGQTLKLIKQ